jgi:hypothetical protein
LGLNLYAEPLWLIYRRTVVTVTAEFKALNRLEQLSTMFYLVSGVFLLVLLPFSSFAPHVALIGVFSLVTGVIVLLKKEWTVAFVAVQFFTVMAFAVWTLLALGTGNLPFTVFLVVYAALDVVSTLSLTIWSKTASF